MKKINERIHNAIVEAKKESEFIMDEVWNREDLAHALRQIINDKKVALATVFVTGTFTERYGGGFGDLSWYLPSTAKSRAAYRTVEKTIRQGGNLWLYIKPEDDSKPPFLMNQDGVISTSINRVETLFRDVPIKEIVVARNSIDKLFARVGPYDRDNVQNLLYHLVHHASKDMSHVYHVALLAVLTAGSFYETVDGMEFNMPTIENAASSYKTVERQLKKRMDIYVHVFTEWTEGYILGPDGKR